MSIYETIINSVLEGFSSDLDILKLLVMFYFATLLGFYIFIIYRYKSKTYLYNKNLNNSFIFVSIITVATILTIQPNIFVSIGMIVALLIVRFRTFVKSTIDIFFLFWVIGIEISVGAILFEISIGLNLIVTFIMILIIYIPFKNTIYILFIGTSNYNNSSEIKEIASKYTIKSINDSIVLAKMTNNIIAMDTKNLLFNLDNLDNILFSNILQYVGCARY